ncbi:MAG: hypothetical protein IBJ18_11485 [Phycisphaerales bacterium]|nr:hypothetical protein [Phycisphaerales bacterium]
MPDTATPPSTATPPLAIRGYRRAAARLSAEIRALSARIPPQHRTASRLARWTKVDRSLCSRFLAAGAHLDEPLQIFALLPGVDGFRAVLRALGRSGLDRSRVARALAAANIYEECVGLAGGSQSKLVRLTSSLAQQFPAQLTSDPPTTTSSFSSTPTTTPASPREKMFDAMCALTGTSAEAMSLTYAVRHRPDRLALDAVAIQGLVSLRRTSGHLPVVLSRNISPDPLHHRSSTLERDPAHGPSPSSVIGLLSSDPLPVVTASGTGPLTSLLIDPASDAGQDLTVYIGSRQHVQLPSCTEPTHDISLVARVPARWSVIDVFIHHDIPIQPQPKTYESYIGVEGPILGDLAERWYDHLADGSPVTHLGPGLASANWPHAPRHHQAAHILFESTGWNPAHFQHFRLESPLPIWGAQQTIRLVCHQP